MTSNDFSKYYKTISNAEILSIIENPRDYQPLAVEAAKNEFSNRKLTDREVKEARQELIAKQVQKQKEREKIKVIEAKLKTSGQRVIDKINPSKTGISPTEKTIRIIVIVFVSLFLYQFIKYFKVHLIYIKDIPGFPFDSILYLLPPLLLPTAIFLFWKRKIIGWILLTIYLTFSAVGAMSSLIQAFLWEPSGFANLDNIFPRPSSQTSIIQLIFLIGSIYVLCKPNIREAFAIDEKKMTSIIIISGLGSIALKFII